MVSYKPLMVLLAQRGLAKRDLMHMAGISPNTMTQIRKGERVSLAILDRICATLNCDYGDIITYIPDEREEEK